VAESRILLARGGDSYLAIGAMCAHYGAPLATGLIVDDTVRCPWHHACFSLRTGEALRAPALDPVDCWTGETRDGKPPGPRKGGREQSAAGRFGEKAKARHHRGLRSGRQFWRGNVAP
jgi:nitrite reductase/ring-hydroxylating ferredoxin subunit